MSKPVPLPQGHAEALMASANLHAAEAQAALTACEAGVSVREAADALNRHDHRAAADATDDARGHLANLVALLTVCELLAAARGATAVDRAPPLDPQADGDRRDDPGPSAPEAPTGVDADGAAGGGDP